LKFNRFSTVDAFVAWAKDIDDTKMKDKYYPTLVGSKIQLFNLGYIAAQSAHSKGSTVDLTMIKIGDQVKEVEVKPKILANDDEIAYLDDGTVDMGSSWDCFHEISHHDSRHITNQS